MMKHISTVAVALVLIAIIQQPLQAAQHTDEGKVQLSQLEHRLVKAVNAHRAKHRPAAERRPSLNACCAAARHLTTATSSTANGVGIGLAKPVSQVGRPTTSPMATRLRRKRRRVGPRRMATRCKCAAISK